MIEALEAHICEETITPVAYETLYKADKSTEFEDQDPLLVFAASLNPDSMYLQEAMKQPDKAQLKQSMKDEVHS